MKLIILIAIILIVLGVLAVIFVPRMKESFASNQLTRHDVHRLFSEHAIYTKIVITDILALLPSMDADVARLLKNQQDIGAALALKIGTVKGKILADALTEHIKLAAAAITAVRQNNEAHLNADIVQLMDNAEKIGAFLSSLNPCALSREKVTAEFKQHNKYVLDMTMAHARGEFARVNELFDEYYAHMLMFADMLYNAL